MGPIEEARQKAAQIASEAPYVSLEELIVNALNLRLPIGVRRSIAKKAIRDMP